VGAKKLQKKQNFCIFFACKIPEKVYNLRKGKKINARAKK
jgi:hypothetical protein